MSRFLRVASLVLIGATLGALLGRRWLGAEADAVLATIAFLTLAVFIIALLIWLARPAMQKHLTIQSAAGQERVAIRDLSRLEFLELLLTLPSARIATLRLRRQAPTPQPPRLPQPVLWQVARQAIVTRPWRGVALLVAGLAIAWMLIQIPKLPRDSDFTGMVIVWLVAGITYAITVAPPNGMPRINWHAWWQTHGRSALVVGALTLVAFVLRVWDIGGIPFVLDGDEGSFATQAVRVLNGEIGSPFFSGHLSQPTLSFFYDALGLLLLGPTIAGARLPWALLGTLTIPITFWLVSRLKGPRFGFVTAALVATYHFHIHFSRKNLNNIADTFWASLVVLLVYRATSRRSPFDWMLLGMSAGGALYFYTGARLVLIIAAVLIAYLFLHERLRFWDKHRVGLFIAAGAFLIVAAPMIQNAILSPDEFNGRMNQITLIGTNLLQWEMDNRHWSATQVLWDQFIRSVLAFNFFPDTINHYGLPGPLLDPFFGALFAVGVGYGTLRAFLPGADRHLFPMVVWWWSGIILGGMLTLRPPATMRLITLAVPVCFFIALALDELVRGLRRAFMRVPVNALLALGVLAFAVISLKTYFVDFSPKRLSGGLQAEVCTEIGPLLNELGPTYRTYFFGAPFIFSDFPTLPFLTPHAQITNVESPLESAPPAAWIPAGRGGIFVVLPTRIRDLSLIRQTFPGGELREIRTPRDNSIIATLYQVPP